MDYEHGLIYAFENLDISKFEVQFLPPIIFLCGGPLTSNTAYPASLRERIANYCDKNEKEIDQAFFHAEAFKDYITKGNYTDLLEFERDIAGVASLIIICLESAGSLVEFGMFCDNVDSIDKLLIIAPTDKINKEDSFIYLGPISYLRNSNKSSVLIYPFPDGNQQHYEHTENIVHDIKSKLEEIKPKEIFNSENRAHLAFLIYEIIRLAYPIKFKEISFALYAVLGNQHKNPADSDVHGLLYLLEEIKLIKYETYSSRKYYYPVNDKLIRITHDRNTQGIVKDQLKKKIAIRQTFLSDQNDAARKRSTVLKIINPPNKEGA